MRVRSLQDGRSAISVRPLGTHGDVLCACGVLSFGEERMTRRRGRFSTLLRIASLLFVVGCDAADITFGALDLAAAIIGAVD